MGNVTAGAPGRERAVRAPGSHGPAAWDPRASWAATCWPLGIWPQGRARWDPRKPRGLGFIS